MTGNLNLFPDIAPDVLMALGKMTVRFGVLERIIFTAMARIKCADEGRHNKECLLEKIGKYKIGEYEVGKHKRPGTLGDLIEAADKMFKGHVFDWWNVEELTTLKDQRNIIHDAIVEESGVLIFQASGKREHRPVDCRTLQSLCDAVEQMIRQINKGSKNHKKYEATKSLEMME